MANAKYGKTFHIRLQGDQLVRFDRVYANYRGLPASVLLRMILNHSLAAKSEVELKAIIEAGIRGEESPNLKLHSRIANTNTRRGQH